MVRTRNLNASLRVVGDFLPPVVLRVVGKAVRAQIGGVEMAPRQRIQRLDRVIADADVDEILLDERADAGDIRIVGLLVQHRTAVAAEAACPAGSVGRRREEEPRAAPLRRASARGHPRPGNGRTACSG